MFVDGKGTGIDDVCVNSVGSMSGYHGIQELHQDFHVSPDSVTAVGLHSMMVQL